MRSIEVRISCTCWLSERNELIGEKNCESRLWNASSMPTVNSPSMMSHTPSVSTTTFASCMSAEGSAPRYCVMRARRACVAASAAW